MKRKVKIFISAMILVVLFANFSLTLAVGNSDANLTSIEEDVVVIRNKYMDDDEEEEVGFWENQKNKALDLIEKAVSWFILKMGDGLMWLIGIVAGSEDISIDAILFDEYNRITLTFFDSDLRYFEKGNNELLSTGAKQSVNWVFSFFTKVSLTAYMIILVYMGIRVMLMSTTANKKAKYKEVLFDWIKGIAILFLFPYVIKYVILLNHAFVTYIGENAGASISEGSASISAVSSAQGLATTGNYEPSNQDDNYMTVMREKARQEGSIADAICYFIMVSQIVQFLIVYMKRLITVMFLIAIFPLVAISYAVDKIGDGKSQAFDHWTKEFILQVFVQSFHAMNYVLIMGLVLQLDENISAENPMHGGVWILKIIAIGYVAKGGDILKGLFAQMKGGGAGGTMEVAKSYIKAKVAMKAIKGVGGAASKLVGSKSLIGKGVNLINEGRDKSLKAKALSAQDVARRIVGDRNKIFEPYGAFAEEWKNHGEVKEKLDVLSDPNLSKEKRQEVTNDLKTLLDKKFDIAFRDLINSLPDLSPEELMKASKKLNSLSEEKLNAALEKAGVLPDDPRRKEIEDFINYSAGLTVLTNRKAAKPAEIQTVVETMIKIKESRNSLVNKFDRVAYQRLIPTELINTPTVRNMNDYLRLVSATSSIDINPEMIAARRAVEPDRSGETQAERVRRAMVAIRTAHNGEYDLEELHQHYEVVMNARHSGDADLQNIVEEESKEMRFTLEDFGDNLAIQTINYSADAYGDEHAQARVDQSIRLVKNMESSGRNKEMLKGLNADVSKLQEGYIPEIIDRNREEQDKLQEEFKKKFEEDPYSVDMGEEYNEYLQRQVMQLREDARKDMVAGFATTAIGAATASHILGVEVAAAGVTAGFSMQHSDSVEDLFVTIPTAVSTVDNIATGAGNLAGKVFSPANKAMKTTSYATSNKALGINNEYYDEQARMGDVNRKLSDAERERQRLLNRISRRVGDASDD